MIKLSRLADYAVIIMTSMASEPQKLMSTSDLASYSHLSEATVSKLLKSLHKAKLLTSERGLKGGYKLAKPSEAITMSDIITAVDGPIALTKCSDTEGEDCSLESLCPTRVGWKRINDAVRHAFEDVTLKDMITPLPMGEEIHG